MNWRLLAQVLLGLAGFLCLAAAVWMTVRSWASGRSPEGAPRSMGERLAMVAILAAMLLFLAWRQGWLPFIP